MAEVLFFWPLYHQPQLQQKAQLHYGCVRVSVNVCIWCLCISGLRVLQAAAAAFAGAATLR